MKTLSLIIVASVGFAAPQQAAEKTPATPAQPPVVTAAPVPPTQPEPRVYEYDQKLAGGARALVTPEQAQGIIEKFKGSYQKLGNPRVVIYVNRDLVDEEAGMKLIARTEKIDSTTTETRTLQEQKAGAEATSGDGTSSTTEKASRENRYRRSDRKDLTLSDRQTVRDIERLVGRPLRMAGARLADQRVATQLIADRPLKSLATEGETARKDREALSKIADVAVEILLSSKKVEVAELSGNQTYQVPDMQVTALRLSDAAVLGQASSSDVLRGSPSSNARSFDIRQIAEAVSLALMEDMTSDAQGAPAAR